MNEPPGTVDDDSDMPVPRAHDRTVNVRVSARATSTCRCSGTPTARSPVIRIVRVPAKPRVGG